MLLTKPRLVSERKETQRGGKGFKKRKIITGGKKRKKKNTFFFLLFLPLFSFSSLSLPSFLFSRFSKSRQTEKKKEDLCSPFFFPGFLFSLWFFLKLLVFFFFNRYFRLFVPRRTKTKIEKKKRETEETKNTGEGI
jgi:hypothetical protein